MSDKTGISWTNATWNPLVGCGVVSPGCTNCYAMREAGRRLAMTPKYRGLTLGSKAGAVWTGEVRLWEPALDQPLRWKKPRMIFVNSMGDLFHESVPDEWIDRIFAVMRLCPQHQFQTLTKRASRQRDYMNSSAQDFPGATRNDDIACAAWSIRDELSEGKKRLVFTDEQCMVQPEDWPLKNWWAGVSVEDQARADERIPLLLQTPAAVRWISAEPLLGPVDFCNLEIPRRWGSGLLDAFTLDFKDHHQQVLAGPPSGRAPLDWVVVGSESGPGARPCDLDWVRSIRDQCAAAGVAFFWKQHADHGRKISTPELDGKRWVEYPR